MATAEAVTHVMGRQIAGVLGVDPCAYAAGPPGARPRLHRDGSVTRDGRPVGAGRTGLPVNEVVEVPVGRGGTVPGRFVVTEAPRALWPSLEQRLVAVILAEQAAASIERPSPPTHAI